METINVDSMCESEVSELKIAEFSAKVAQLCDDALIAMQATRAYSIVNPRDMQGIWTRDCRAADLLGDLNLLLKKRFDSMIPSIYPSRVAYLHDIANNGNLTREDVVAVAAKW